MKSWRTRQTVIEKVDTPTSWINPLVAAEKPSGDIRTRLDIQRKKHPVSTVEETVQEISSAKVFTKPKFQHGFPSN